MLDWNKPYTLDYANIGRIELMPRISFDVKRIATLRYNTESRRQEIIGESFSVSFELDGNTSGLTFKTRQDVESYLEAQKNLLPQYRELIEKRDALSKRIRPLNAKWFKLADKFFDLAKSDSTK